MARKKPVSPSMPACGVSSLVNGAPQSSPPKSTQAPASPSASAPAAWSQSPAASRPAAALSTPPSDDAGKPGDDERRHSAVSSSSSTCCSWSERAISARPTSSSPKTSGSAAR